MCRSTITPVTIAVLFTGAVGAYAAQASSTSLRIVPVVGANEHGIPGAVAVANDPALLDKVLYSLVVTVPTGGDWTNSEIRIVLTRGSAYNAAPPGGTEGSPSGPPLWSTAAFSPGAYDTFVNAKNLAAASIVGHLDANNDAGPLPAKGLTQTTPPATEVSVVWGALTLGEDGTFQIGQFVLSADAAGTFFGRTYAVESAGGGPEFHFFQGPIFPEPSGLAGLLLSGLALLRRRRTA